jgi:hypothetical protein
VTEGDYSPTNFLKRDDLESPSGLGPFPTLFTLLGLDPTTEMHDQLNRPIPISYGQALQSIIG